VPFVLRVLTYHRIADPAHTPQLHPRLVSATPTVFAQHLDLLVRRYQVVSLAAVLATARGEARLPRRAVLLTFDDAYRDFLDAAWPLLMARGLPAVMFVPTAYPGSPERAFWWDRLYRCFTATTLPALEVPPLGTLALDSGARRWNSVVAVQAHVKSLPADTAMNFVDTLAARLGEPVMRERAVLSWEELRQLATAGLALCPHTRTHPLLTRVTPERAHAEVRDSLLDLRREIGDTPPVFAYPSGAHDPASIEAVRRAGFELAFTQVDGHDDLQRTDLLRLHRTNITRRTTAFGLELRLQRWMTWIDRWRHRERGRRPPTREVRA
jgi:peptidoglycan/xylan/chitin deacetylase (PgdA/CDA1 family)